MARNDKKRAAEETADRLRDQILKGEYPAGRDLPGERELSIKLGVSRLTLRAALTRLEAEGLVKPVHGSGNRVLDFRATGGVELLGHLLVIGAQPAPGERGGSAQKSIELLSNLLELRRFAAVEAIGIAAQRATVDEIAELRAQIDKQASLLAKPDEYIRADLDFARMLARATHNLALSLLANTIVRVLEAQEGIAFTFLLDLPGTIAVYRRFIDLIESRDVQAARAFSRRLITNFDRGLIARLRSLSNLTEADPAPETKDLTASELPLDRDHVEES